MFDPWLKRGARRGGRTAAEQMRHLRVLRVPKDVCQTLQQWAASPETLEPLLRQIRDIVFPNAVYRASMAQERRLAGRAREPHYAGRPEEPGTLRPLRQLVDQMVADLKQLLTEQFTAPIELEELNATHEPTGRTVRRSQLDGGLREAVETARSALIGLQAELHKATDRRRGRKATLVQPFRVSAFRDRAARPMPARRRELERQLRDELLRFHPNRVTRPHAARLETGRLARRIGSSILPRQSRTSPLPRAGR
jgi:hypothetical protein